jgi:hypothetical protein
MRSRLRLSAAFILFSALTLAGCAGEPLTAEPDEVLQVEEAVADIPRHPLTGAELGSAVGSGPSIAVKIDNTSSGRPQVGIASADIVYEELVEGGVTRYLAVFHTTVPDEVGPVRSGRPQDAGIIPAFGGVFVFSGVGNSNVREIIGASGLKLVEHDTSGGTDDAPLFFRSDRKPAPWNLHIKAADLFASYSALAAPPQQFDFVSDPSESTAAVSGENADSIRVTFSKGVESVWQWDMKTGTYLKFLSNGNPDVDADGTQISATNVLIFTPNYVDVEGLPSAEIAGTTETALIATGGKLVTGLFDASVVGEPIQLTHGESEPVFLGTGKTFVLLPPGAGSVANGVTPGSVSYGPLGAEVSRAI